MCCDCDSDVCTNQSTQNKCKQTHKYGNNTFNLMSYIINPIVILLSINAGFVKYLFFLFFIGFEVDSIGLAVIVILKCHVKLVVLVVWLNFSTIWGCQLSILTNLYINFSAKYWYDVAIVAWVKCYWALLSVFVFTFLLTEKSKKIQRKTLKEWWLLLSMIPPRMTIMWV